MVTASRKELWLLLGMTFVVLVLTGYKPFDLTTWFLEVFPVLVAIPLLALTREGFPLTRLLYWLIFVHALILMVGGTIPTRACRSVSGCRTGSTSRATTTIASATSRRVSCRQ